MYRLSNWLGFFLKLEARLVTHPLYLFLFFPCIILCSLTPAYLNFTLKCRGPAGLFRCLSEELDIFLYALGIPMSSRTCISKSITLTNPGFADLSCPLTSFDYLSFVWGFVPLSFQPIQFKSTFSLKLRVYLPGTIRFLHHVNQDINGKQGTLRQRDQFKESSHTSGCFQSCECQGPAEASPVAGTTISSLLAAVVPWGRVQTEVQGSHIRIFQGYNSS